MLRDFVEETANAPGSAVTFALAGAATGARTLLAAFGAGGVGYFGMHDGVQGQTVRGQVSSGTPATFTILEVLANTANTTARLSFTGPVRIYCAAPGLRSAYLEPSGLLPVAQMPAPLASQLFSNTGQLIPHNTPTTVTWDTVGGLNTLGAAGSGGFTIPYDGLFRCTLNYTFEAGNGAGIRAVSLIVGGVDRTSPLLPGSLPRADLHTSWEAQLAAGTVVTAVAVQTSGVALSGGGNPRNSFSCVRLG